MGILNCDFDASNVYLYNGSYLIEPDAVNIISATEIEIEVNIPADAQIGLYDIVVGAGLAPECSFVCEGCFEVTTDVGVKPVWANAFTITPNPFTSTIAISAPIQLDMANIEIIDMNGKLIYSDNVDALNELNIDLPNLPKGMYLLKVKAEQGEVNRKLLRQ